MVDCGVVDNSGFVVCVSDDPVVVLAAWVPWWALRHWSYY